MSNNKGTTAPIYSDKDPDPFIIERRAKNREWETYVTNSITELNKAHAEIKTTLFRNTTITEEIYTIIDSAKTFFRVCTVASKFFLFMFKFGTIAGASIIALYHALDSIMAHNLWDIIKGIPKK